MVYPLKMNQKFAVVTTEKRGSRYGISVLEL